MIFRPPPLAVLLFGACAIGFAPILVRLSDTGPASAGFWRFLFAAPLLLLLTRVAEGGGPGRPSKAMLLAGVFIAVDLAFWHYGIRYTSVANATVLSNLTPLAVAVAAWLVWKERPRALFVVGLALAIGGVALMALAGDGGRGTNPALGNALSMVTAIWYAAYFFAIAYARRTDSTLRVMTWSTLVGTPIFLLAALTLGEPILPASAAGWAACVGLGVMHVAGQGSIAWALGRLPAATTSVVVLIQPVVAAALGWALFAEAIGPVQALGAAAALAGVALAQGAGVVRERPAGIAPAAPVAKVAPGSGG